MIAQAKERWGLPGGTSLKRLGRIGALRGSERLLLVGQTLGGSCVTRFLPPLQLQGDFVEIQTLALAHKR